MGETGTVDLVFTRKLKIRITNRKLVFKGILPLRSIIRTIAAKLDYAKPF